MGREPHQLAQCANTPLRAGNTGHWLLPRCPPFFDAQGAIITMGSAFRRLLRHRIRNKGAKGGPGCTQGGHGHGNPCRKNSCPPSSNQLVPVI